MEQLRVTNMELRVALHLDASDGVKAEVNALVDALDVCREELAVVSATAPIDANAFQLLDDTFERIVWPVLTRCGTAMAQDLGSR